VNVTNGSCTDADTVVVTIDSAIIVDIGVDTALCLGDSLMPDASNTGADYLWSTNDTVQSITVSTSDTIWVNVTRGYCSNSDTIIIYVDSSLVIDLGEDTTICSNSSLSLAGPSGADAYQWSTGDTVQNIVVNSPDSVVLSVVNGACASSDTIIISVDTSLIFDLGPDTTICSDSSLSLAGPSGADAYQWSTGDTIQNIAVSSADSVVLSVIRGACTSSDTIIINVDDSYLVDIGPDTDLCEGEQLLLDAGSGADTYLWSSGQTTDTLRVNMNGTYRITTTTGVCTTSDTIEVTFQSRPADLGIIPPGPVTINSGEKIQLDVTGSFTIYQWSPNTVSDPVIQDPIAQPQITTTYLISVTTFEGCVFLDSILIIVEDPCIEDRLFIPNAFTPNGDGIDDELRLFGAEQLDLNYFHINGIAH